MTADNKQQTAADGRTLVIAAAGTGGHVMPGLAVARVMADRGWKIVWIGTTTGMEKGLVERQGIEFHPLNFQGMRGRGITGMITGGIKMLKAIWDARKLLKKLRPTAVFSTGGYIAVPVCFAAQNLKRPIVLMNCDADLLMSTNTVLPFCDALACGFAGGARTFAGIKGHTTGNPVRAEIAALPAPAERFAGRTGPLKLFIFGGSLGAQVLNDVLPQALAMIPESERPIVLHQTGRDRDAAVREAYAKAGVAAEVVPFIDDMAARTVATGVVPYPPGIPLLMPGENAGAADGPILGYLKALQAFDRDFPGFGHDTHGVEIRDGMYYVLCIKKA